MFSTATLLSKLAIILSIMLSIALIFAGILALFGQLDGCSTQTPPSSDVTPDDDNPTPGGNQTGTGNSNVNVTTGKLKVDIVDSTGISVVGKSLSYMTETGGAVQFAPGVVHYTQAFAIKNTGDVTFNYELFITQTEQMKELRFADAFDFWLTTDPSDPSDLSEAQEIRSFRGTLEAGKTGQYYYLVISMKEGAGNEFQGMSWDGIGITVNATQAE